MSSGGLKEYSKLIHYFDFMPEEWLLRCKMKNLVAKLSIVFRKRASNLLKDPKANLCLDLPKLFICFKSFPEKSDYAQETFN